LRFRNKFTSDFTILHQHLVHSSLIHIVSHIAEERNDIQLIN